MTALTYDGKRTFTVQHPEHRTPGPGEVSIAVAYTGICGTDLHVFHGDMDARVGLGAVLGHEMSGRIAATGQGVDEWQVGDAVTVMPIVWCGECPACRAGDTSWCHKLVFLGLDAPGSLQSEWVVPAHTLVRLPDGISLRQAALVEPTAVAVHDVGRGDVAAGERVLVVGGGPVGQLIAVVARHRGAEVRLVEPDESRRAIAAAMGIESYDPAAVDVAEEVDRWTGNAGADVCFEVSGAAAGVSTAVQTLKVRGRLVLVAIHGQPREVDLFRFFWRELQLIGARLYERADFEEAVRLLAEGVVPVDVLISAVVPLSTGELAFAALDRGGVMKVLVDCSSAATA
jgi:(R,R)-butanediol dehydrogenase / meso-butanediol dehydrogenase / diacetyl reductase